MPGRFGREQAVAAGGARGRSIGGTEAALGGGFARLPCSGVDGAACALHPRRPPPPIRSMPPTCLNKYSLCTSRARGCCHAVSVLHANQYAAAAAEDHCCASRPCSRYCLTFAQPPALPPPPTLPTHCTQSYRGDTHKSICTSFRITGKDKKFILIFSQEVTKNNIFFPMVIELLYL